jgi:hypothetical protein
MQRARFVRRPRDGYRAPGGERACRPRAERIDATLAEQEEARGDPERFTLRRRFHRAIADDVGIAHSGPSRAENAARPRPALQPAQRDAGRCLDRPAQGHRRGELAERTRPGVMQVHLSDIPKIAETSRPAPISRRRRLTERTISRAGAPSRSATRNRDGTNLALVRPDVVRLRTSGRRERRASSLLLHHLYGRVSVEEIETCKAQIASDSPHRAGAWSRAFLCTSRSSWAKAISSLFDSYRQLWAPRPQGDDRLLTTSCWC